MLNKKASCKKKKERKVQHGIIYIRSPQNIICEQIHMQEKYENMHENHTEEKASNFTYIVTSGPAQQDFSRSCNILFSLKKYLKSIWQNFNIWS